MRYACLFVTAVLVVVVSGVVANAQPEKAWPDRDFIVQEMDNRPGVVANVMADILSQAHLNAIHQALQPVVTDDTKVKRLEDVKAQLTRAGIAADDEVMVSINRKLEALKGVSREP